MKTKKPCVYCMTNSNKLGVFYIGGTMSGSHCRFSNHLQQLRRGAHKNPFLQNVYNKYGEDGWSIEELESFDKTVDEHIVFKKEAEYIKRFEKEGKKLFNALLNPINTYPNKDQRFKIAEHMRKNNPMKNKGSLEDMLKSRKEAVKKIFIFDESLGLKTIASGSTEAARFIGVDASNIIRALKARRRVNGFLVSRDENDCFSDVLKKKKRRGTRGIKGGGDNVIMLNLKGEILKTFNCCVDAASFVGVDFSNINRALNRKAKSCGGFLWLWGSELNENAIRCCVAEIHNRAAPSDKRNEKISKSLCKRVNKIDPKTLSIVKTYESAKEAAKKVRVVPSTISRAARRSDKVCRGFLWSYA